MADIDIEVNSSDLKAAIDLLNEYGMSFTGMVNKVQTEGNRLARASKATTDQITQAWKNAEQAIENRKLEEVAREEQATLKRREQNWKQFFQNDFLKKGNTGITASNSLLLQSLQDQASEEKRILDLRAQRYKQFFQQEFLKEPSAGQGGAPRSASDSALVQQEKQLAAALDETARATKELERERASLTAKLNPLLAAEQAYLRMQKDIDRALELQIINEQQQIAQLQQLEREYKALGQGVYLAGSRFNQFGEMAGISGKAASRFGMYAQQAGYQVGDFAVQLQSGANAGVAFSQQAAQLAGLIPGLAGAVTTFAAIGLGLVIQNLTRGKKEAEETYAQLSKFSDLEQIFNSVGSSFETSMVQSLSRVRAEYGAFVADIAKFQLQNELDTLKSNLSTVMREATTNDPTASARWFGRVVQFGGSNGNVEQARAAAQAAQDYNDILAQVQAAQDRLFNGDINSKSELVATYVDVYETISNIPGISDTILDRFKQVAIEAGIWSEVQEETNNKLTRSVEVSSNAFQLYKELNQELRQSNDLARVKAQYGEQSVQYLNAERDQIIANLRTEMERAGVHDTLITKIIRMKEEQIAYEQSAIRSQLAVETLQRVLEGMAGIDISGIFLRAQAAANGLLGTVNAIGRGLSQVGQLGLEARALQAENNALKNGATPGEARVAGQVTRYGDSLNLPDGFMNNIAKGMLTKAFENQSLENLKYTEENSDMVSAYNDAQKPDSGGGKGKKEKKTDAEKEAERSKKKLEEFFEQYNLNIKQQERLLGVQGEQREELEKVIEIENRLGEARSMVSQAQIEAMAREELALERKLQREQEIYNLGKNSVENLLMTVVQGTASIEDAFKVMLSNIIMEIYKNFVAEGAADIAGNALVSLLSAKGNAFGTGGVKMFANGGVVNSPTLFGYGGGKTGMMGEAGPEAIMPLKRNSQGRLGVEVSGGGTSTVHVTNVFQMSANGDAAVKAIIQGEMPRIAETTKRAVIDANRRSQKGFR